MRRLIAAAVLMAIVALAPACRTKRKPRAKVADDDGQLASVVNVADPRAAVQLVSGFHALENDSWRWTARQFTVTLRPPPAAGQNGAQLELKFSLPDAVFQKVGAVTISAKINGVDLPPQTYSAAGEATYTRDIPASALHGDAAAFNFSVDKAIPPSDQDQRELAIIVTTIGLTVK